MKSLVLIKIRIDVPGTGPATGTFTLPIVILLRQFYQSIQPNRSFRSFRFPIYIRGIHESRCAAEGLALH